MLKIENGVVDLKIKNPNELLDDVRIAMGIFIKYSKDHGIPDNVIEKTTMMMVVEGFNHLNDIVIWDDNDKEEK